jgi:protocatechuate 3,4-dioxygenase beta subunit
MRTAPTPLTRRAVSAALLALPSLWVGPRARAQALRRPTPQQSEGPFYPLALPADSDFDLLRNGGLAYGQGQPGWVQGVVSDLRGRPVAGAQVEIWQCDANGHYDHPGDGGRSDRAFQGFGKVIVGADGQYRFRTIRPVAYSGRAPHIHVKVRLGQRDLLTTQMYVRGDPHNQRDFLWRSLRDEEDRNALTVAFESGTDGLQAVFPIIVQT